MINIGQANAAIDTPVEHLMACHRRIEDRLATLERAADHLRGDKPVDEEESLFPRVRPHLTPEELHYLNISGVPVLERFFRTLVVRKNNIRR